MRVGGLMDKKLALVLLISMLMPGCTTALVVNGSLTETGEKLTGEATRYMDGGTIEIYGSRGTHCTGIFTNNNKAEGVGRLLCDDRRSGPFTINVRDKKGRGDLNGHILAFALADPHDTKR